MGNYPPFLSSVQKGFVSWEYSDFAPIGVALSALFSKLYLFLEQTTVYFKCPQFHPFLLFCIEVANLNTLFAVSPIAESFFKILNLMFKFHICGANTTSS
ncbi:hypothetical protein GDO81_004853 [Engystomops pustulosus]|uniref:Uncharacterized protein n=1 Tax=Engystomops pustulosus TaxID=76066 RepID=A0AAV7CIX5_ENGPU|nr:hypothetical protein GDO81_004853 [Engystomops pustulosus]